MKSTIGKSGIAGIAAFIMTGLVLTLLLIITNASHSVNIPVESVAKQDKIKVDSQVHHPPIYLLIAIGVVGIIGIRRKKSKNTCDASCRTPQPDNELSKEGSVKKASNSSVPI